MLAFFPGRGFKVFVKVYRDQGHFFRVLWFRVFEA